MENNTLIFPTKLFKHDSSWVKKEKSLESPR